jgi:hypothetical protein
VTQQKLKRIPKAGSTIYAPLTNPQLATKEIHSQLQEIVYNSKISSFATNLFAR